MEWIRISTHKLKIMLNAEDARHYALDPKRADYEDTMTRETFREILSDVQKKAGFETGEDRLYIQMYPSKEGGCELFVTRMGLALQEASPRVFTPIKKQKSPLTGRKKAAALQFESLAPLLALCRRIGDCFEGESEAWRDDVGRWWLLLHCTGENAEAILRAATEYGTCAHAEAARRLLPEHAQPVCRKNAVETLKKC